MARAIEVARYLIRLASPTEDEDADCLSHLRLQKLLYYVQAWHLASCGKPLFSGRIEAWVHGPVVREIYSSFADYRFTAIPPKEGDESSTLTLKEKAFIRSVWEQYKKYSATAFREMTHNEQPWLDARRGLPAGARSDAEIPVESIRASFEPRLREAIRKSDSHVNLELWERSGTAIEAGEAQTAEEIRRAIHSRRAGTNSG